MRFLSQVGCDEKCDLDATDNIIIDQNGVKRRFAQRDVPHQRDILFLLNLAKREVFGYDIRRLQVADLARFDLSSFESSKTSRFRFCR